MAYVVKKAGDEGVILDVPRATLSVAFTLPAELLVPKSKVWRRVFWGDLEVHIVEEAMINNSNRILVCLRTGEENSVEAWMNSVQGQKLRRFNLHKMKG